MRKHLQIDEELVRDDHDGGEDDAAATGGLPNRLLTSVALMLDKSDQIAYNRLRY